MPIEERSQIAQALQDRLNQAKLQSLVSEEQRRNIPRILATDGLLQRPITESHRLAEILADLHGAELLRDKAIRTALLDTVNDENLAALLHAAGKSERSRAAKIAAIAGCKWTAGKLWARTFVRILGLPTCLSGQPSEGGLGAYETVEPYVPLKPLHDFQIILRNRVLNLLGDASISRRAILTLPTGAGKTRTTVEALVGFLRQQLEARGQVLWIAQSEELCEQAVASFREVWMEQLIRESQEGYRSPPRSLHIQRLWGTFRFPAEGIEPGGVIVAGIQKLAEMTSLDPLLEQISVLVVDEAHHAIAPSYTGMFRQLDKLERPILGLTATPFRGSDDESARLIKRFKGCLITPPLENPMEELRQQGILSRIVAEECLTQSRFKLSGDELTHAEMMHELSQKTLNRIGNDVERNRRILTRLLEVPHGKSVLLFACNVEHSQLLSLLLRRKGRTAASVTAETPETMRRRWIQEFKEGPLQFLCNVGVLTTGFDAPRIEVIAIARPTGSVLLYEQMVGRGMRGPKNGGTKECLLIDFTDNIQNFAEPMSYTRISRMWTDSALRMRELRSHDRSGDASEASR
jgi:superfamily II DNA or RNA helicase